MARAPRYRASIPVICIGNFTAGGTGKTPLAMLIGERLKARGASPVFLTRGYGGRRRGPWWVEPSSDPASEVGDEPMLLARVAPVLIARDRVHGARLIEAHQPRADVIVMDDGLQNPALGKSLRIVVIDGHRGVGNGEVIPAGPLRADLAFQLRFADVIVVNQPPASSPGGAGRSPVEWLREVYPGPLLQARTVAAGDTAWLKEGPVVAFAGIANPQRFYDLLTGLGADVAETWSFADHQAYNTTEAHVLLARARALQARLVTTEKDWVRLSGATGVLADLAVAARPLPIRLQFAGLDEVRLDGLLDEIFRSPSRPAAGGP